jgi:hypothetical protein
MRTKLIASVVALGSVLAIGWYVAAQATFPFGPLPLFSPNTVLTANQLNEMVQRINAIIEAISNNLANTPQEIVVNCPTNSLAAALNTANNGDTIKISGTCSELVTISKDGLTLDGQGTAILDGGGGFTVPAAVGFSEGVITINGARGVVIKGLTVQNGPDGISGNLGANFTVQNVTARRNADDGIQVNQNSSATLIDCTAEDNGDDGINVFASSSATFHGTIVSIGNGDDGINIAATSSVFLAEATVMANGNGFSATFGSETSDGLFAGAGIAAEAAHLSVGGNSSITTNGNADDGMQLLRGSSLSGAGVPERGPITITSEGNGTLSPSGDGILVFSSSSFNASGTLVTLTVRNNGLRGLAVVGNSHISCARATVTSTGNGQANVFESGTCP